MECDAGLSCNRSALPQATRVLSHSDDNENGAELPIENRAVKSCPKVIDAAMDAERLTAIGSDFVERKAVRFNQLVSFS